MHELSIARAVVREVTAAVGEAAPRVREVHVAVGRLSGIVSEALAYGWTFASATTPLEGAQLVVEDVDVVIWCQPCGTKRRVRGSGFTCPTCDTPSDDFRAGRELLVRRVLLDDPPGSPEERVGSQDRQRPTARERARELAGVL